jgi:uncharacterized GH25 family protein
MKTHKHLIYVLSVTFALILVSILVNVTKRVSFIEDFLNSNIAHNQKSPPKSQDTKADSNKLTTQFNNYYSTNPINKNDLVKVAALTQGSEIRIYAAGFNALNPTPTNSPTRKIGGEHPKLTLLINDKPVLTAAIIARRTTYDTNAEEYPELQQIVYYSDKKVKFSQIKI